MQQINISDKAQAIYALEKERAELTKEALEVAYHMQKTYDNFWASMIKLNEKQLTVLRKQTALDDTLVKLLGG